MQKVNELHSKTNFHIILKEILNNEDCEDLDPGSGSIHSAGNISLSQQYQRGISSNRIQLSSTRPGQSITGGTSLTGSEKALPPNSLNLSSTTSKYLYQMKVN